MNQTEKLEILSEIRKAMTEDTSIFSEKDLAKKVNTTESVIKSLEEEYSAEDTEDLFFKCQKDVFIFQKQKA